jgi:hypothetical protein
MKELEKYNKISTEIKATIPIKKKTKLLGSLYPQKGHKCFEINNLTLEINEAKFESVTINITSISQENYVNKKLLVKENCTYITALNKKNAMKKFKNVY